MDYSVYIIKQNTPESRLLSRTGINRDELPVNEWKGKRQRFGGFGRTPCEWRIVGVNKVKMFCETIVRILENREELDNVERKALNRTKKTLEGIINIKEKRIKQTEIRNNKKELIMTYLSSLYPTIDKTKINILASKMAIESYSSILLIHDLAKKELHEINSINEARKSFKETMRLK